MAESRPASHGYRDRGSPGSTVSTEERAFIDAFLSAAASAPRRIDSDLMAGHERSLSEYNVLVDLSVAPGHRLRVGELASAGSLSLSRISRLVGTLEREGLVRRELVPQDRRCWSVTLTETGWDALRAGARTYAGSVRRHLLDGLDRDNLARLTASLRRIGNRPGGHATSAR